MSDEAPDVVAVGDHKCCSGRWGVTGNPILTLTVPCPHCGTTAEIVPARDAQEEDSP